MPALVGGFGNKSSSVCLIQKFISIPNRIIYLNNLNTLSFFSLIKICSPLGPLNKNLIFNKLNFYKIRLGQGQGQNI